MKKIKNIYFAAALVFYICGLLLFYKEITSSFFLFLLAVTLPLAATVFLFLKLKQLYKTVSLQTRKLTNSNIFLQRKIDKELQKSQERNKMLIHQSKMSAMGEIISNIAHQWRQPLSAISTAASAMKLQKELNILSDETFDYSYHMIMKNSELLSETINSFRDFFTIDKEKTKFSLHETILKNIDLVKNRLIENNIRLHSSFDESIFLFGYKNEFMQVIINLFNNAIDALKIKSVKENKIILITTKIEANFIVIKVYDNADGVKQEIKDKIFEPYFTTKHQTQGTGIGLYMSQEIIVNHMNGSIKSENCSFEVEEKEYFGALFTISIPVMHN